MPAVQHAFTGNGGGRFSNAVCSTKYHLTHSAVSFLEWSSRLRHVWRR